MHYGHKNMQKPGWWIQSTSETILIHIQLSGTVLNNLRIRCTKENGMHFQTAGMPSVLDTIPKRLGLRPQASTPCGIRSTKVRLLSRLSKITPYKWPHYILATTIFTV